jgi:hypothetical protein
MAARRRTRTPAGGGNDSRDGSRAGASDTCRNRKYRAAAAMVATGAAARMTASGRASARRVDGAEKIESELIRRKRSRVGGNGYQIVFVEIGDHGGHEWSPQPGPCTMLNIVELTDDIAWRATR